MQVMTRISTRIGKAFAAVALALTLLAATGHASAASVFFNTYESADADGLKVRMKIFDKGDDGWLFEFKNLSTVESSLTGVFFEEGTKYDKIVMNSRTSEALSEPGTSFAKVMGGDPIGDDLVNWQGTGVSFVAGNAAAGLDAGTDDRLRFYVKKNTNTHTLDELLAYFALEGSRIAVNLVGLPGGTAGMILGAVTLPSNDTQNPSNPVHTPSPAAFGAGLAILAGGLMRRRTH